jgi:PhoPQ-activated pathogenicity-related protein
MKITVFLTAATGLLLAGCGEKSNPPAQQPTNFAPSADRIKATPPTALDRYVAAPDTNFQWHAVNTFKQPGVTVHVLALTSQAWLTAKEVNKPIWKHYLTIAVPDQTTNSTALLIISGGSNEKPAPTKPDRAITMIAKNANTVVANLNNIPSEPLVFPDRPNPLSEDAIIAYTWDKFLRTGDEKWPLRLPMTKAAVRAMDAITAFCGSEAGGDHKVEKFFVTGASKRGWTTWTTAAVDSRVVGIAPIVIDVLNVEKSLIAHYEDYGFFAPAVDSYAKEHIMDWLGTPQFHRLMQIVDPYEYRARLTLPKLIITAAGDQFFPTDSAQFYLNDLPGVKYIHTVPNANHSINSTEETMSVLAFYYALVHGDPLPQFDWKHDAPGELQITTRTQPIEMKLWQATNPNARDFRLETLGPAWKSTDVKIEKSGHYTIHVPKPTKGWTAYFVELKFSNNLISPYDFTTDARVVPDERPYHWVKPKSPLASNTGK